MLDSEFYDELEIRDPDERELSMFEALQRHVRAAKEDVPYFARLLADVDPGALRTRADLAAIPVTRKSELSDLQKEDPPLAGMSAIAPENFARLYQSPGPTYEGEAEGKDWWRLGRALFAVGVRPGDIVHNTFSYHLTPAAMMVEGGARAIGCAVIPAGTGQTEQQVQAIEHLRPSAYAGTPSFLKILLARAAETGADASSIKKAALSGEGLPEALRAEFEAQGIRTQQCYASADLGLIAYESKSKQGLIVDERLIVEIVRPGTGDPVPTGEVGEVVVTTFNRDYPLIRFATGDLSAVMAGASPCGRTNMRLKGWMGRADQAVKVKGMFVHPKQVAETLKRHPGIARARLVVDEDAGQDRMTLMCETEAADEGLAIAAAETLHGLSGLKCQGARVAPGTLANDGVVIEDRRGKG